MGAVASPASDHALVSVPKPACSARSYTKTEELEVLREAMYSTRVEAIIAPASAILWRSLAAALSLGVEGADSVDVGENGVDAPDCSKGMAGVQRMRRKTSGSVGGVGSGHCDDLFTVEFGMRARKFRRKPGSLFPPGYGANCANDGVMHSGT